MKLFLLLLLIGGSAAGGFAAALAAVERWHARIYAAGDSPIARVSGFATYAGVAMCRPLGGEPWRIAFRRTHACHVAVRGREASLHIGPDGLPRSANLSWYPPTVAEAVFERDSVRREFERQGGRLCLERRDATMTIQVWTVGSVRAVIGLDTLRARGPAIHVFGVDSTLSPCTPARIGLN